MIPFVSKKHKMVTAMPVTVFFCSLLGLAATMSSCDSTEDPFVANYHRDLYPIQTDEWLLYDVDSISYTDIALPLITTDSQSYQIKEYYASYFVDLVGDSCCRLERYKRRQDSGEFKIDRVWTVKSLPYEIQKTEDDLRYRKLILPPAEGKSWDGNSYINTSGDYEYLDGWQYQMQDIFQPYEVKGTVYDSTVTVIQIDESNLIEKRFSKEVYAKGIGLIYKELTLLQKQNVSNGWDKPETGYSMIYQLVDHSFE